MKLSGYEIKKTLGKGGMATVYLAEQLSLHREVAIKVLDASLREDAVVKGQFEQESRLVGRLHHPNIIQVYDQGVSDEGQAYFVMQFVKSVNLESVTKRADVSLTRKLDIIVQICKALSYAHRNGVVHRDIKPANVLVDYEGCVRVVDFGIAGYFENEDSSDVVMGTPAYMAPEQAQVGGKVTAKSDIYSLGVLMHELFYGANPSEEVAAVSLPKPLRAIIAACLQRDPEQRPDSADQIRQHILLMLQGKHLENPQWENDKVLDAIPEGYRLLDVLKENDYGATYLVRDPKRKQFLVIKKQKLAFQGRALEVNKQLVGIDHPHITKIYGTAKNERVFITVSEYVSGGSLEERLTQAFPLDHWLMLARQLCEALELAHQKGIVHGNLRPSNLLLVNPSQIKLTDFGFDAHNDKQRDWYQPLENQSDEQADIYSAGAVLFHVLTGQPLHIEQGKQTNLSALNHLPKPLEAVLVKMLQLDGRARYQKIGQVKLALMAFSDEQQTQITRPIVVPQQTIDDKVVVKRRGKPAAVAIVALVLVILSLEFLWLGYQGFLGKAIQHWLENLSLSLGVI